MDRLETLRLFGRVVELGSFTRAAAELNLPRATASHAIQQLEARLGTRLLERTTRHVRPTADGQAYYQRCMAVLAELDDAEAALDPGARPRGSLRLDLHGSHATRVILPNIGDFHRRYPDIELVISSGDRLVDLVREGIDCVVRAGQLRDSSLVARRLTVLPEVICASPEYLREHGVPRHPDELAQHHAVGFFASQEDRAYPFELIVDGAVRSYQPGGWMRVNDAECYVACALQGCGLVQLPRFRVEEQLRSGVLVQVLADWPAPGLPVSVLYPQHRQLSPRVRVFVDWVVAIYAARFGPLAPHTL